MDNLTKKFLEQLVLSLAKGEVPINIVVDPEVIRNMFVFLKMDDKYKNYISREFNNLKYKDIYLENITNTNRLNTRIRGAAEYYTLYNLNNGVETMTNFFIGPYSRPVQILSSTKI